MSNVVISVVRPESARAIFGGGLIDTLRKDMLAGLTVAAISLPQSMAYALIAGVDPRLGLYTAVVFTAVAGIFGSSRHLVNGPTGAVSLVVFSALAFIDPEARLDSYEAMFLLAAMMGVIQVFIAVLRLGDLMRYISESVVTGFIAGAAVLTMVGQVANALGVKAQGTGHQQVLYRLYLTLSQNVAFNPRAIFLSLGAILLAVASRKIVRKLKLPQIDMLFTVLSLSLAAYVLGWSDAAPGGKPLIALVEPVPPALPGLHVPQIQFSWLADMSGSAFAIALLGILEALAISKAIAHKSGQTLDYNRQILAEGLGNLTGAFFRCMPGSGSLSRTAINYQAGAATRFSGLFAALAVAVAVVFLGPLAAFIPKAVLAGLLIVAAGRLIDAPRLRYTLLGSRYDALLAGATALAALAIGVEFSILIGVALSVILYVPRAAKLSAQELIVSPERLVRARIAADPPAQGVAIHDIEGELFFGAAPQFEAYLQKAAKEARELGVRHIVLRLKRARNPDAVSLEVLDSFLSEAREQGLTVLLAGLRPDLIASLTRFGILERHPDELIFPEEETDYSATLKAVRNAYALAARHARMTGGAEGPVISDAQLAYYLI
jgi:SulP family sulfate permease